MKYDLAEESERIAFAAMIKTLKQEGIAFSVTRSERANYAYINITGALL